MTETALERVQRALGTVTGYTPPNGKADWLCPAHDDSTPSLSVAQGDKGVVLKCQANCDAKDVVAALGLKMSDLFDTQSNGNGVRRQQRELVDAYPYHDENGTLLFEVVRFRDPDGKKAFQQRRPLPDGGWEWKLGETRRVLYRLPQVIAAVAARQPIFVVEGEKDVAAIERAGGVATCNAGGAGKWRKEYAEVLRGAEVCIVADNDAPGTKHAADVEASLVNVAKRVTVVQASTGKDAADHLAAGHGLEEWLVQLRPRALERTLLGHLMRTGVPAPAMVHKWLYAGGLHSLQGEPGVGKSWVALWLCLQLMLAGYAVVYIDEEGGEELVTERLIALGADPDMIDERFFYFPFPEREWNEADIEALADLLASIRLSVGAVVLDSLPDVLDAAGLSEDSSMDVTGLVRRILRPVRDIGAALLVLDHLGKPGAEQEQKKSGKKRSKYARGSGAKLAKAHLTMLLEAPEEFDRNTSGKMYLWATKDRRGASGLPRLNKPPLILDVTVVNGTLGIEVRSDASATGDWDGPTHCMESAMRYLMDSEGLKLSTSKVVAGLKARGEGYRRETVEAALQRLLLAGDIRHETGRSRSELWWYEEHEEGSELGEDEQF